MIYTTSWFREAEDDRMHTITPQFPQKTYPHAIENRLNALKILAIKCFLVSSYREDL